MFNIGGAEMVVLAVLALIVFGPESLPSIAKSAARTLRALRQAGEDFKHEVRTAVDEEHRRLDIEKRRRSTPEEETSPAQPVGAPEEPVPVDPAPEDEGAGETSVEPAALNAEEATPAVEQAPPEEVETQPVPATAGSDTLVEAAEEPSSQEESGDDDDDGPGVPMNTIPKTPNVEATT